MNSFSSSESPLETAGGAVDPNAIRAFEVLADETRLAILVALWEAHEPFADDNSVPFSALMDRVGYETSSNFSYHLDRLEGRYVESTPNGYRLKQAGHRIVRAVVAGAGIAEWSLAPTDIGIPCTACGEELAIGYADEHLYTVCRACEGRFGGEDHEPRGTMMSFAFDPAGLANRSPTELFAASVFRAMQKFTMQMGGLCPACSGHVEASLDVCEDHDADGICDTCDRRDALESRWVCTVCKNAGHSPPGPNLILHPRVMAFYDGHGLEIGYDATDFEDIRRMLTAMETHESELLSTDPLRVQVTVRCDGDELTLVVDEELSVVKSL